jgi:hypothetical protein
MKRWLVGVAGRDPIEIFVLVNARDGELATNKALQIIRKRCSGFQESATTAWSLDELKTRKQGILDPGEG